ncbi:MAG: hypothetical protein GY814_19240, partial [Gammaproteobacteria bacterium]|nr:hypothetical protein [Gammaproteobacteria bacterium]
MSELTLCTLLMKRKNELKKDYNKQENYDMQDEETIAVFEKQIKELQAKIDALKERKEVWTPKEGPWRLSTDLKTYLASKRATGVGAGYATREDALAAVPLRYNQQMLEAYKREFDPAFKPKFDGSQANYYPKYVP